MFLSFSYCVRTIEDNFNLGTLGRNDSIATPFSYNGLPNPSSSNKLEAFVFLITFLVVVSLVV